MNITDERWLPYTVSECAGRFGLTSCKAAIHFLIFLLHEDDLDVLTMTISNLKCWFSRPLPRSGTIPSSSNRL